MKMSHSRLFDIEERAARMEDRRRFLKIRGPKPVDRSNPLEDLDEVQFLRRHRLRKSTFLFLLNMVGEDLKRPRNRGCPVPPLVELCIVLRFYATDSFQLDIADIYKVNQATVSRMVVRVSKAIAARAKNHIVYPSAANASKNRTDFFKIAGFPGVVGCIDCTHVAIISPGGTNAEMFRNRKGYCSLNIQAICDANLLFTDVVVRWFGSCHDSRIFDNSAIKDKLEHKEAPGILLGDGGYACTSYLLTPLLRPSPGKEKRYNDAQIRTRNCIERAFGVWKRRFSCLRMLRVKLANATVVCTAVAVLHNICRKQSDFYQNDEYDPAQPLSNAQGQQNSNTNGTISGRAARAQIIASYF